MIDLYDGKYGVENHSGKLIIYRHGKHWPEKEQDYIGDGFVLSLVQKIEELQEENKISKVFINMESVFPLHSILEHLVKATDILLHDKDYDGHEWEVLQYAMNEAKRILKDVENYK